MLQGPDFLEVSLIYHISKEKLLYEERCKELRIRGMSESGKN